MQERVTDDLIVWSFPFSTFVADLCRLWRWEG